jgi:large subunit ribosomal protein L15
MGIQLHDLTPGNSRKKAKRVGRGMASTKGKTSGRGHKGQKARSGTGGFKRLGLRKMLLATPKLRGFASPNENSQVVSLENVAKHATKGEVVTPKVLASKGLIKSHKKPVKILADGEIDMAITVKRCAVSKSAAEKIIAAGGKVEA